MQIKTDQDFGQSWARFSRDAIVPHNQRLESRIIH